MLPSDADIDMPRAKRGLIDMWQQGQGDTLVKVMPHGIMPDADRAVGYCTTIKYLISATPRDMEDRLGFRADSKLALGADIYLVDPLPAPNQFEPKGYSQLPDGVPQVNGRVLNPDYPPGRGVPQWELHDYPQSALHLLASVLPGQTFRYMYADLPPAPRNVFMQNPA
jgi:hypothetical protein